jgi:hypothetical protein
LNSRFGAGALIGLVGALLMIFLGVAGVAIYIGILISIVAGVVAAFLVSRGSKFATRTVGAGTLAGLFAGIFLFIGQVIAGGAYINGLPASDPLKSTVQQTIQAQATATVTAGGSYPDVNQLVTTGSILAGALLGFGVGLLDVGLSVGAGAITGAITRRPNQLPPMTPPIPPTFPPAQ